MHGKPKSITARTHRQNLPPFSLFVDVTKFMTARAHNFHMGVVSVEKAENRGRRVLKDGLRFRKYEYSRREYVSLFSSILI